MAVVLSSGESVEEARQRAALGASKMIVTHD